MTTEKAKNTWAARLEKHMAPRNKIKVVMYDTLHEWPLLTLKNLPVKHKKDPPLTDLLSKRSRDGICIYLKRVNLFCYNASSDGTGQAVAHGGWLANWPGSGLVGRRLVSAVSSRQVRQVGS